MKTRKQRSWNPPVKRLIWVFAAALMLLNVHQAMASTAENTTITNTVTVTYDDTEGAAMDAITATADVTVTLVPAAPTISSPTDIDPTTENTANTLTYTVAGNANGDDSYTITFGLVNTDIGSVSVADVAVTLGGTTLAANTNSTFTITVPYDGTNNGIVNSIAPGDTIVIGVVAYQVAATGIDEGSGDTTNTATITLMNEGQGAPTGSVGDIVGEQQEVNVTVTTASLAAGATVGTYAVTATISSDTDSSESAAQDPVTTITVRLTQLTVAKYVRDIDNAGGTTPSYDYNGATYYTSVSAAPAATLEYIVVVTNDTGAALNATNVVIEDPIPQFTSYVSGTISLDPDIDDSGDPLVSLSDTPGDDAGELNGDTVRIHAGTGGTASDGGTLAEDQTTVGIFRVTID